MTEATATVVKGKIGAGAGKANASDVEARVEAVLVTSDRAATAGRIADVLGLRLEDGGASVVEEAIGHLNAVYDSTRRAFRIERVAGGFRIMTRPEFGSVVTAMEEARSGSRLSQAAMETLAIIAYRQPITRADVEAIRGVSCGEVLRGLLERHLIKIEGRAEEVGRPMLYGTTRQFLEAFGLATLKDLPSASELTAP